MESDVSSRKPTARITPNDSTRARSQPYTPHGASLTAPQIFSSAVSSAAKTVVAPISSVNSLIRVAIGDQDD
jgi:hypothetical protein